MLAPVYKTSAQAFKILACLIGQDEYQIDAFGADIFIVVALHEPMAHYRMVGSRPGSITLSGPGLGHVYRTGSGAGHAPRPIPCGTRDQGQGQTR